ncbi:MAG: trigger factor [Candidatus Bipolaricaulota bacterium]
MNHTQAMQVEQDGPTVQLTISVPKDALCAAEERLKEEIRRSVRIPGFRPGNAPLHLALARYGQEEYKTELKEHLIKEWLNKTIDEHNLRPATSPKVEVSTFEPGEKLEFRASFEVFPEVEIPDVPEVEIPEPPAPEVPDQEIDDVLRDLRRRSAALKPREGSAHAGDVVRLSRGDHTWEAEVDPEGALGAQLVGAEAGQEVAVTHEDSEETFSVEGVYEVLLPDPKEVAEQYGKDSWDELREEVKNELLKQAEADAEQRRRTGALDTLADSLGVEPPPGLLAEVVNEEMSRFGGKEELRGEIESAVRRRLRRELVSRMVCEQKGLFPKEDEVTAQAEETNQDAAAVRAKLLTIRAADWVLESQRRDS